MKIIALYLCLGVASCVGQDRSSGLANYVDRDLRKLSKKDLTVLKERFKGLTGDRLGPEWAGSPMQAWALFHYDTPGTAWALVEAYPGLSIPDISGMKLHFFDKSWTRTSQQLFPTGYRLFLNSVTVEKRKEVDRPLIIAKATSSGPFITSPGPKRPAFEQGNFEFQYYVLLGTNVVMVRLEDDKGTVARNRYVSRSPFKGPALPQRTKQEWLKSLDSSNSVEQLAALVWLTGVHLTSSAERMADHNQESVEDSKLFESVRDDAHTKSILNRLQSNANKWIRDYAILGSQ